MFPQQSKRDLNSPRCKLPENANVVHLYLTRAEVEQHNRKHIEEVKGLADGPTFVQHRGGMRVTEATNFAHWLTSHQRALCDKPWRQPSTPGCSEVLEAKEPRRLWMADEVPSPSRSRVLCRPTCNATIQQRTRTRPCQWHFLQGEDL